MKKIIFIPGFTEGKRGMFVAKKILKDYNLIYFEYNTFLIQTIEEIAKELKNFVKSLNLKKNEKINIIGVSAGGAIALYYAKFLDKRKMKKIYTIHSPLKGSYCLSPLKLKGACQLKTNSEFLKKLAANKKKINQLNFWNYFDFIVPGNSGKGENPRNTFMPIHPIIKWWPKIYYSIKRDLQKNQKTT